MRKTEEYSIKLSEDNEVVENKRVKNDKVNIFEVFGAIVGALVTITFIFLFCFRVFEVEGSSMTPTLQHGDSVCVSTIGYTPKQGDVVVLAGADGVNKPIVKRIIAVGGDRVDINFTTGVVTVNGREEHYADDLTTQQKDIAFPLVVPEGTVFVLGDNRAMSLDSRSSEIGCVDERQIVGKVLFRYLPLGDLKVL
ncbi:MAG: signal peptidase I [Clostridia bacterium]|nr:signal peptidase I [Clostridia bacterium]